MEYVRVAIDTPVDSTFDYHVPPELEGRLQPGHLVEVAFGPARQHAIVLEVMAESSVSKTKPILNRLDPVPVLTPMQIALSLWLRTTTLSPIGAALWMWLPPGLTGHHDLTVTLLDPDFVSPDDLEMEVVQILKRRGMLRSQQLNQALPAKTWRPVIDALAKAGIVAKESTLTPPRVKPRIVQTAALAIHPHEIAHGLRHVEKESRPADLLGVIAEAGGSVTLKAAFKLAGAGKAHLAKLVEAGDVAVANDVITLKLAPEQVEERLHQLRKVDKAQRILSVLARHREPLDVGWLYAQADCTLPDLKKLEEAELITLGERETWRDSLAEREFIAVTAPTLTIEQAAVWERVRAAIRQQGQRLNLGNDEFDLPLLQLSQPTPPPTPPRIQGGGTDETLGGENERQWRVPKHLYAKLKSIAREMRTAPTPAEEWLWAYLRGQKLGYRIRRQHPVERFITDFYCAEAQLVIEIDGEIHQYQPDEDAARLELLEALDLRVLRFTNDQVIYQTDTVLQHIQQVIAEQVTSLSAREPQSPLPEFGEGSGEGSERTAPFDFELGPGVGSDFTPPTDSEPNLGFDSWPEEGKTFLLHGVTGSGKTEIYLRAVEETLRLGRKAIVLVPEISLTPQTIRRVAARFPGQVAVVHSGLSEGERYDTWRRAREGRIGVIVGARSALFTPLPDVGLIILDEEHDPSYKQSPPIQPPYYHARDVAEEMMRRNGGVVILGSATPDINTTYRAQHGDIERLELPHRIMGHRVSISTQAERTGIAARYQPADAEDALMIDLPPVQVVDMRDELKRGNISIFSRPLQYALAEVLDRKQQAILFLNRRGQSTYVFCRDCGYVAKCPQCDNPLTYHRMGESLRCHRCGHMQDSPTQCPACQSKRIKFFGAGTQQVEQTLIDMFPKARTVRWDSDTATSHEAHEAILQRFIDRKADIMIGTQLVAKGLDLPMVTLVGVVSADIGLALPDFRAGERTFQVLTQVAGRAGRGLLGGRVILQTYQPEHYAIQAAAKHDYPGFYKQQLEHLREIGYPPFRRLARILFRFPTETKARSEAIRAAQMIRQRIEEQQLTGTEIIGPAQCFFPREANIFRWHLLVRSPDPAAALGDLDIPRGWYVDIDPVEVL
ncbi:MAG: primosomal protein N' [Anaerolineae bacterium]|nr:primosomal protein N' [Anaerolineae bacterium]